MLMGSTALALVVAVPPAKAEDPSQAQQIAQAAETHSFDIAAQALDKAITAFGRQSGWQVSVDQSVLTGKTSPGVKGTLPPQQALQQLLSGTGVAWRMTDAKTVVLEKSAATEAMELGPVTVLGSRRSDVPLSNVPSSISYVNKETIQKDLAIGSRAEDVLTRNVPGFNPSNLGTRTIRGRTAQVFVNGAPTNEQMRHSSGSDINLIAPGHLESIEVSRGANAGYGFGSPGGIIALTTPRATSEALAARTKVSTSFNTAQPGGSFQSTLYQSLSQIVGEFDYHVGASFTRDGTDFTPAGEEANTFSSPALLKNGSEDIYNLDGSFGYDLGDAGRLRLTSTYQYLDYGKYYDLSGGLYRRSYAKGVEVANSGLSTRKAGTANLTYEKDDFLGSALKLEAFGSDVETDRYETGNIRYDVDNRYLGFRSAVTTPLDTIGKGVSVTYGLDAVRNEMSYDRYSTSSGALTGVFAPATTLDMLAPYAQMEVPVGKTKLSGGVRQEFYGGKVESVGNGTVSQADDRAGGDIENFNLALFNLGLLHPLTNTVDAHATYSQGAEITQLGRSAFGATSAARVEPEAARSHQYETGVRYNGGDISAAFATFFTHSKLMSSVDCSNTNIPCLPLREPRQIWGAEFSGDWKIDPVWSLAGMVAWQDGRRKATGASWSRISSSDLAPLHGSTSLGYAPMEGWRNNLTMDWRAGRGRISSGWPYGSVTPLALVHFSSFVDIGPGTLSFGIHNLFDQTYTSIQAEAASLDSSWAPEQGRRVMLGYDIKW